jgi:hypothetical protein
MATAACFTYLCLQAAVCARRDGHGAAGVAAVLAGFAGGAASWALFPCDATLSVWALPFAGAYWRMLTRRGAFWPHGQQ